MITCKETEKLNLKIFNFCILIQIFFLNNIIVFIDGDFQTINFIRQNEIPSKLLSQSG